MFALDESQVRQYLTIGSFLFLTAFVYDQFSGDQEDLHHEPHHQYFVPVQDVYIELSVVNISMQWSGRISDMNRTYIELNAGAKVTQMC